MNRETIRIASDFFELPFGWALTRRIDYLQDLSAQVVKRIEKLERLRMECREGSETVLCDRLLNTWIKAFSRVQSMIKDLKFPSRKPNENGITDQMIEAARCRDIRELIDEEPNRSGMVHCEFHEDKTASVSLKKGRYHCFGCGLDLNPVDFLMKKEGLSFIAAIKQLN